MNLPVVLFQQTRPMRTRNDAESKSWPMLRFGLINLEAHYGKTLINQLPTMNCEDEC